MSVALFTGVSVLLDLEKFFDQLPAAQAASFARDAGIPRYMIRAAMVAHGWTRYLRAGPAIDAGIAPEIVAGDGSAMLIVAAYMAQGLQQISSALGPMDTRSACGF